MPVGATIASATVVRAVLLPLLQAVDAAKPATRPCSFGLRIVAPICGKFGDTLRKIDVDAVVVDEHALHLKVRSLTVLLVRELDERVLETVA